MYFSLNLLVKRLAFIGGAAALLMIAVDFYASISIAGNTFNTNDYWMQFVIGLLLLLFAYKYDDVFNALVGKFIKDETRLVWGERIGSVLGVLFVIGLIIKMFR